MLLAAHGNEGDAARSSSGYAQGYGIRSSAGLQGRHFERPDLIWVSADIAQGPGRPTRAVSLTWLQWSKRSGATSRPDEYVLPAQRPADPARTGVVRVSRSGHGRRRLFGASFAASPSGRHRGAHYPHTLRHAYADHVVRHADIRIAQIVLGHTTIATTEIYIGRPTLDELKRFLRRRRFRASETEQPF